MPVPLTAADKRLLSLTERELVEMVKPRKVADCKETDLKAIQKRLRAARDRAKRIARTQAREMVGSTAPRRRTAARDNTGSVGKLDVLVAALERVGAQLKALKKPTQAELSKKALAMKRAAATTARPAAGRTAKAGLKAKPSAKPRTTVKGSKVGSVSAATKRKQAKRDGR